MFKRRERRPILQAVREFLWPRGGWARAFEYVKLRLRRLPDTPERISRGVWAGVFAAFTPFYGLHFVVAAIMAKLMRGNIFAALMATFFGNPLTYIPIGVASLGTGYWMLGMPLDRSLFSGGPDNCGIGCRFGNAFSDLRDNFIALFTDEKMDWRGLSDFFHEVFWPYFLGGIIPGIITATICYCLVLPVISAYQKRRRKRLREKLEQLSTGNAESRSNSADNS